MSKLLQRLLDPNRSGVYRAGSAQTIKDATAGSALDVVSIDSGPQPLESIGRALEFPASYGGNWDALEDSLGDLSWRKARGHVLLFETYPQDELALLTDVLASSAAFWKRQGRPFFAVFIDPARQLRLPDLYREA